jgi:hypothetical protein
MQQQPHTQHSQQPQPQHSRFRDAASRSLLQQQGGSSSSMGSPGCSPKVSSSGVRLTRLALPDGLGGSSSGRVMSPLARVTSPSGSGPCLSPGSLDVLQRRSSSSLSHRWGGIGADEDCWRFVLLVVACCMSRRCAMPCYDMLSSAYTCPGLTSHRACVSSLSVSCLQKPLPKLINHNQQPHQAAAPLCCQPP